MANMVPVRRTLPITPNKGMWTLDPADRIPDGASPDMLNFQLYQGYIRKRPGYAKFQSGSTFPGGSITGVVSAQQTAGGRALYVTNLVGLYKYNHSTQNFDAQTGPALTGSASELFSFEVSQNCLVFSQGVDNIMSLPLTGTVYAVLSADAKPAKYLTRWNQRLYTAFTLEGGVPAPFRVRWPVNGDHTNWTGVGSGFVDLSDDVYQLKGIRKILDVLAAYTEKGVFLGSKTGVATSPANFALQVKDIGLASPFTLQGRNVQHFMIGTDDFYLFDSGQMQAVATQVRQTIFAELDPSQQDTNFGLLFYDTQEYGAFIKTLANTTKAWVYNWIRQAVYPWQFASSLFTCACLHILDSSTTIADLVGTIASQTWVIGSLTLSANFPIPILGGNDGKVYFLGNGILADDGAAFTCRWTSKDYTARDIEEGAENLMITMNGVGFEYVDPGTQFTLNFSFSIDRGQTWTGPFPVTVGGGPVGSFGDAMCTAYQATGKRVRFKVENATTDENPQIASFAVDLELRRQKVA